MMQRLTDSQISAFHRDGFLNGGKLLDDGQVAGLLAELMRIIDKGPDGFGEDEPKPILFRDMAKGAGETGVAGKTPVWQIVNIWEASPAFERLIFHPYIVSAIHQLTGSRDLQVWHDQVQYKPANTGGCTKWHQDAPLWPSIEPMTEVSAWIPFADATEDNGCMWMVPGSHRWGNQQQFLNTQGHLKGLAEFADLRGFTPPSDSPISQVKAVACPVRAGEVHFHHALTWHGSPENRSPHARPGLAIHYMTSDAYFTGRGHPMAPHIQVQVGQKMLHAGPHFPVVCRDGQPVAMQDAIA